MLSSAIANLSQNISFTKIRWSLNAAEDPGKEIIFYQVRYQQIQYHMSQITESKGRFRAFNIQPKTGKTFL